MGEPTVVHAVEFHRPDQLEIRHTDRVVKLRLWHAEVEMTPAAARDLAALLLKIADRIEPS